MNTDPGHATSIAGLLSLMADLVDPASREATRTSSEAPALERRDLVAALEHVSRGWLSVREDGHGWLLVQFAPAPEPAPETRPATPKPRFGSAEQKVASLTEREREVLCLVASGATNCAIASRLFISPKTASVHVSHILAKLGAETRTEAAAYAHAAGLVQPWGNLRPAGDSLGMGERQLVGA
jgi:DNA-binding NarL/FixJ family response regulator